MAESCTHDCSTCGSNCPSRTQPQDLKAPANAASHIKHVIGVVSGKGGVGKSMVTTSLAVAMNRLGRKVGILDADITGPSIPRAFGLKGPVVADDNGMLPRPGRLAGLYDRRLRQAVLDRHLLGGY